MADFERIASSSTADVLLPGKRGASASTRIPLDDLAAAAAGQRAAFPLEVAQLQDLVDPKSTKKLTELGGTARIVELLQSDAKRGLTTSSSSSTASADGTDTLAQRRAQFGTNRLPATKSAPFLLLVWEAMQDRTQIILMIAAVISIAIGIYDEIVYDNAVKAAQEAGEEVPAAKLGHWVEGLAILIAVIVVVLVNSINDYQKEKQFRKLNSKKEDREVNVVRDGEQCQISIYDLVVGDVCAVAYGDIIPADGLLLEGRSLRCDESGMTGESDAIKKDLVDDPFLLSGTKVLEGNGYMIVINVGISSLNGKTMMALRTENEDTPLQVKLGHLAENIGKVGLCVAIVMLVVLVIKFLILGSIYGWPPGSEIASAIVGFFITSVTIVVVAVPEGLPMAVTLALAYATIQMLKDQNLVRVLAACETMGGATTICSDKTGTLTQNKMTVVQGSIAEAVFRNPQDAATLNKALPASIRATIVDGLAVNSTAYEGKDDKGRVTFVGSKTEQALLNFCKLLNGDYMAIRQELKVEHALPFSSERKRMSTVVRQRSGDGLRLYCKGASESVLELCNRYITGTGEVKELDDVVRAQINVTINAYASDALRTISLAYNDMADIEAGTELTDAAESGLIFLGIVGIQDPVRPEVPDAVRACQRAGIRVRMVTGDNLVTACNIAKQCGILTKNGTVMEGAEFRRLSPAQMDRRVATLQVLARSSPTDKQLLVACLKGLGETVAVTGDGTNDGPALKLADVGFAMGIAGTEVAKEASDIIIMDDNFASIVKAVIWGRSVYDSVRKFLQFQLTVNVAAVSLAFISAVADPLGESVLSAVQLLWVNLIMDTMAALALATEPPTPALLNRPPHSKADPLISFHMWRMIIGQAILQVTTTLVLFFAGPAIFHLQAVEGDETQTAINRMTVRTIVFNTFVFLQIFNEFNSRSITQDIHVFRGITKHVSFIVIFLITVVLQVLIVQFGGAAFKTYPLNWWQWLVCVFLGPLSLVVGLVVRLLPDWRRPSNRSASEMGVSKEKLLWEDAIDSVRTQIRVVNALRHTKKELL